MLKRLIGREDGDTIVEVLIAIAVISSVLVSAYVVTRHSLAAVQDTQEHSEALQLAQTQIEFLHSLHTAPPSTGCFYSDGTAFAHGDAHCVVDASGVQGGRYTVAVIPTASASVYQVQITWDSVAGSSQPNNVTLYYQQYVTP